MNGLQTIGGDPGTLHGLGPDHLRAAAPGPPPQALPGLHLNGLPHREQMQFAQ